MPVPVLVCLYLYLELYDWPTVDAWDELNIDLNINLKLEYFKSLSSEKQRSWLSAFIILLCVCALYTVIDPANLEIRGW